MPALVVVDVREKSSDVPNILKGKGVRVDFKMLDVGDYVVSTFAVERKEIKDFISSLFSGRLFDQAYRLSEAYQFPLMIVEGDLHEAISELRNPRVFWGALISLSFNFGVRVFFTSTQKQTAEFISTLTKQLPSKVSRRPPLIVKKPRIEKLEEAQLLVVESLPGIGPKLADRLLRRFETVRAIFKASRGELNYKGNIDRARADRIVKLLDSKYQPGASSPKQVRLIEE